MRNENYFEKKLEMAKESILFAKSKLEHLDVQMKALQVRFEHDQKVYNDQAKHMQEVVKEMEKRVPALEKKIEQGYSHIDLRTGKAFKSFEAIHEEHLKEQIEAALENQKAIEANRARKLALRNKKRQDKLSPEEKQIVEAEEVRESLQGPDEIAEIYEKQQEALQKKVERYEKQLEDLKAPKPIEVEIPIPEPTPEVIPEPKELHEGKTQCDECGEWFTKGGAFAKHYQSHFNGE